MNVEAIPFNKPFLTGKETEYITRAVGLGKISGDGAYTGKCHKFFEERYGFSKALLTHSCTAALEMTALLMDVKLGDEVIMPSYTFVSSANAFALRGAKVVFCDSMPDQPNACIEDIERRITDKTRAVIVVHYGGVPCEIDRLQSLCTERGLFLVEDAAHCIDAFYKGQSLGSFGHFSAFSFHETKNVICGEGGMIVINDPDYIRVAEMIREKGTNRSAFFRGEVDKYTWKSIGSSYLPSEVQAAFLYAQLEEIERIQVRRVHLWKRYDKALSKLGRKGIQTMQINEGASVNGHLYFLVCRDVNQRNELINFLKSRKIHAVFHYLPLHLSPYYLKDHQVEELPNAERFADCLLRLPLYFELDDGSQDRVIEAVLHFFEN